MEIKDVKEIAENLNKEEVKSMFQLLKEKKYFAFLKAFLIALWGLYGKYLKGKYVTVKGKKVPLTAIIVAVIGFWAVLPSSSEEKAVVTEEPKKEAFVEQEQKAVEADANSYDKDGLKIYGFEKCEQAICGMMENSSDKTFGRVIISVTFNDRQKNVVAEGSIDAKDVKPMTRTKLKISSEVDFYSFTLSDVTVE